MDGEIGNYRFEGVAPHALDCKPKQILRVVATQRSPNVIHRLVVIIVMEDRRWSVRKVMGVVGPSGLDAYAIIAWTSCP